MTTKKTDDTPAAKIQALEQEINKLDGDIIATQTEIATAMESGDIKAVDGFVQAKARLEILQHRQIACKGLLYKARVAQAREKVEAADAESKKAVTAWNVAKEKWFDELMASHEARMAKAIFREEKYPAKMIELRKVRRLAVQHRLDALCALRDIAPEEAQKFGMGSLV